MATRKVAGPILATRKSATPAGQLKKVSSSSKSAIRIQRQCKVDVKETDCNRKKKFCSVLGGSHSVMVQVILADAIVTGK